MIKTTVFPASRAAFGPKGLISKWGLHERICKKSRALVYSQREEKRETSGLPGSTPRTRLRTKKDPMMMRGMKYSQFQVAPKASLVWKKEKWFFSIILHQNHLPGEGLHSHSFTCRVMQQVQWNIDIHCVASLPIWCDCRVTHSPMYTVQGTMSLSHSSMYLNSLISSPNG